MPLKFLSLSVSFTVYLKTFKQSIWQSINTNSIFNHTLNFGNGSSGVLDNPSIALSPRPFYTSPPFRHIFPPSLRAVPSPIPTLPPPHGGRGGHPARRQPPALLPLPTGAH